MHNIEYRYFDEDVDKNEATNEINEYVARETWEEGGGGLYNPIIWKKNLEPFKNLEEAIKYIESIDKGSYGAYAVRYKSTTKESWSKKIETLKKRVEEKRKKYEDMEKNLHYADVKSQFVSCKKCGSKISVKWLGSNYCPVCKSDLRPESTLQRISDAKKAWYKAEETLDAEKKACKSKRYKTMWVVKFEYHT